MGKKPSIFSSARLIGICTLFSRVLGMVRDVLSSHFFGAGMFWDAFAIAYRVPNLFRRLFGEGALTAAFVPAFVTRLQNNRREEAFTLLNRLLTLLVILLGSLTVVGILFTYVMPTIWPDEKTRLVAGLLRIMLPYVILVCAGAILGAALNSLFKFFAMAFAPVILNVTWIVALPVFAANYPPESAIRAIAWSVVLGGLLQLFTMVIPLMREGVKFKPDWAPSDPGLREVGIQFLPAVLGLALIQVNELVDSIIAEIFVPGHGAVSALYYGNQLTQLPLSLIGTSLATACFPALSAAVAKGDRAEFGALFRKTISATFFLSLPAMVGLVLFSREIISVIFEHGKFTAEDTHRAGMVLALYGASLWCYCANQVQVRAFHAHKDTRTPVKISVAMVGLNLALNLILVFPLREAGIALATSIAGLVNFLILNRVLRKRFPDLEFAEVRRTFLRAAFCAAVMGGLAFAFSRWGLPLLEVLDGTKIWQRGARLGAIMAISMAAYFGLARLMGLRWRR